jgi:hypothetical protein
MDEVMLEVVENVIIIFFALCVLNAFMYLFDSLLRLAYLFMDKGEDSLND